MPLVSQIHIDAVLTNISRAVVNSELVAPKIWPVAPVKKDSDVYYLFDQSNLRPEATEWASKAVAKEINWAVTRDSYVVERHALQELVEDDEKQNQDSPIDVMSDSTTIITEKLQIRREKRLVTVLQAAGSYDAGADVTLAGVDQWSDFASATSDPADDVSLARSVIFGKIAQKPNLMVLPRQVYEKLREHPKILDRIKYVQVGVITPQLLGNLFDIENVLVTGAIENTANEAQADVLSYLWGKHVYIGYVTPRPALRTPSWGYHLQSQPLQTERWRDEERKGEVIRVSYKDVPKLVTKSAGYIIRSAVA
jgi:hypothetical protein